MKKTNPANAPFLTLNELHALANEVREVKTAVVNSRLQLASIEKRLYGIGVAVAIILGWVLLSFFVAIGDRIVRLLG